MKENLASAVFHAQFIVAFCDTHQLDGVDLNWEYPRSPAEWDGLIRLIVALRLRFKRNGRIITMAYYPDGQQERILASHPQAVEAIDLFLVMSYDQHGRHATLDFAELACQRGIKSLPPSKLTLGLPFYGRKIQGGDWKSYEEIVRRWLVRA